MTEHEAEHVLKLRIERQGSKALVQCHGSLVAGVTDGFYQKMRALIPESTTLVLDMAELSRVDSMGLGTLVRLYVSARSAGCTLELKHVGKRVRELFERTHLLQVFASLAETGVKLG